MKIPFSFWNKPASPLIPIMTSNTTPVGVASASINNSTAFNAYNGVGWILPQQFNAGSDFIQYQFISPKYALGYFFNVGANGNISSLFLQGSNDGINFTNITAANLSLNIQYIKSSRKYIYYRILINGNGRFISDGASLQIYGY